jgi:hypothetical protein
VKRSYAAIRLLEHGPLTFGQLVEITGWNPKQVEKVIYPLVDAGVLFYSIGPSHRRLYAMPASTGGV